MKKKSIIVIIIVLIIAITGIITYFITKNTQEKNKDYQIEEISQYQYFVYQEEGKFGVLNTTGNTVIPAKYKEVKIPNPSKAVFVCYTEDGTQVLNETAQPILTEYANVDTLKLKNVSSDLIYEKQVLKYEKDGKYGLIGLEGKQITKPIYEEIDTLQYKEGELLVKKEGKYGVINQKGATLIEAKYDKISADAYYNPETRYRYDGYIVANKTDEGYRYGYISQEGNMYLETSYNDLKRIPEIGDNQEVYIIAAENGRYGVFKNNKKIIENDYQSITYDSTNNIFVVQKGKKYGAINLEGKEILKCEFAQIDIKGKYLYTKNSEGKEEVYSKEGQLTNMSANTMILDITEKPGYTILIQTVDGKTSYQICKDEKTTTDEYMYIQYLENDLFIASKRDGKLGIINSQGEEKAEFKYSTIQRIFDTNLIQMTAENVTEIADTNAQVILTMADANIEQKDQYIQVSNKTETAYFNEQGEQVPSTEVFANNILFAKSQDGKWGFVDKTGNVKADYEYDKVTEFNEYGFAGIQKDGKWGVIKQDGTVLKEPTYELTGQTTPEFLGVYYQVQYGSGQIYYTKK